MTVLTHNSRRDGSPFVNLLMIAPLCDSRGQIRYHIGAQVDVSGLVKDCTDLESFQQLVVNQGEQQDPQPAETDDGQKKDEFQEVRCSPIKSLAPPYRHTVGKCRRDYIASPCGQASRNGVGQDFANVVNPSSLARC